MIIGGLQKTTLIDFPGRVACTVFTIGCNFRCPFCHNKDLVTLKNYKISGLQNISEQSFFEFLDKRKKVLDGVCITGGEPTLQSDLAVFCQKIKRLGLEVKLDTNGSNPEIIDGLLKEKLVDFIAMDVKSDFDNYQNLIKLKIKNEKLKTTIKKSIKLILQSGLEYEFRTTIVPGLHNKENMMELARELKNLAKSINYQIKSINYFLQPFKPQNCLDSNYLKVKPFSEEEIKTMLEFVQKILPNTKLRGVD